jgi:hypothetical protein
MNTYSVIIEDIYDKNKCRKIQVKEINAVSAHKWCLDQVNALREEIVRIISNGKVVFSLKNGFCED